MSKYINYDELKEWLPEIWDSVVEGWVLGWMNTVDSVEIVRCKDCKHFSCKGVPFAKEHGLGACSRVGEGLYLTKVNGYCYLGEKVTE